ncbi:MAG: hypothetical protein KF878_00915 [Planctomycetes bacterium]|nr:hypothetical protein [Planctomycetota bacterium]
MLTFEGEKHVSFRVEGPATERSVFAVATIERDQLAVARVYEADLDDHDPARALRLVYLAREDVELVQAALQSGSSSSRP